MGKVKCSFRLLMEAAAINQTLGGEHPDQNDSSLDDHFENAIVVLRCLQFEFIL